MVPPHDELRKWMEANVPRTDSKSCIEIGCFPGRYLAVLGTLGYELHGIDLTPRVNEIGQWLHSQGYKTGSFSHGNFLEYNSPRSYDLVCSFGFIEHFTNWEEVLQKHIGMVAPGGMLVIETPNFRGFLQNLLHRFLDKENYKRHYIPAMNPNRWKEIAEAAGFEVKYHGWFGQFEFWSDSAPPGFFGKAALKVLSWCMPFLKKRKPGTASLSPYCGIIAVRKHS
jgi:SAM-dependent methyltransferase